MLWIKIETEERPTEYIQVADPREAMCECLNRFGGISATPVAEPPSSLHRTQSA